MSITPKLKGKSRLSKSKRSPFVKDQEMENEEENEDCLSKRSRKSKRAHRQKEML
jgi:hypothetical protein